MFFISFRFNQFLFDGFYRVLFWSMYMLPNVYFSKSSFSNLFLSSIKLCNFCLNTKILHKRIPGFYVFKMLWEKSILVLALTKTKTNHIGKRGQSAPIPIWNSFFLKSSVHYFQNLGIFNLIKLLVENDKIGFVGSFFRWISYQITVFIHKSFVTFCSLVHDEFAIFK